LADAANEEEELPPEAKGSAEQLSLFDK